MQISPDTLGAMRRAIVDAIRNKQDAAIAALQAFADNASLNDWDELAGEKDPV